MITINIPRRFHYQDSRCKICLFPWLPRQHSQSEIHKQSFYFRFIMFGVNCHWEFHGICFSYHFSQFIYSSFTSRKTCI